MKTICNPYTPKKVVESNSFFSIPLYQRLFEWNKDNVIQLLDDLKKAHENGTDYYIGMLTATTDGNKFQLVDGQQRMTMLFLMAYVLQDYYNEWQKFLHINNNPRIYFTSRKYDNAFISDLITHSNYSDSYYSNYKMCIAIDSIRQYFEGLNDAKKIAKYIYEQLRFFISDLPTNYTTRDLNKYFERMNSSGKSLENHEILKVKMLSKISVKDDNISFFMQLWNLISDIDVAIIHKREKEDVKDFIERKNRVIGATIDDIINNPQLIDNLKREDYLDGEKIKDLTETGQKPHSNTTNHFIGSRCVLRFPQLLLQTLYYFKKKRKENDFSPVIDDFFNQNNLLSTFQKYLPYEGNNINVDDIKEFFITLLHCRVILDVCFVRTLDYGYMLDMNLSEDDKNLKHLLMYESMLYVSSSNVSNYRWFGTIIDAVVENGNKIPEVNYLLEKLKMSDERTVPNYENLCFGKDIRYWFWRLDYCIWEKRETLFKNDPNYLEIANNYVFIRNRSIEHVAPQKPENDSLIKWGDSEEDKNIMNSFGNIVMISQGLNSTLHNKSFEVKKAHVESYCKRAKTGSIESLKLLMIYKDFNDKQWNKESIEEHGKQMYEILLSCNNGK